MPHSLDPTYPLFPVLSFLGFVVVLIPFPWHIQAWNSGTCAFMLWTSLACLVEFINGQIWAGNVDNNIPVWCDISSKFLLGAGIGITASSLCISRRLYHIATTQNVSISHSDKRRAVIVDLCIAIGIPFLVMLLHFIVQPHRYDILEDIGCYPAVYNTLPAYFLVFMWPILLGSISFVYSALTLHAFWRRRLQFSQFVGSNSSLSISRYLRLMMLSMIDMIFTVPLGIFSVVFGTQGVGLAPWISWEDTHFNFSRVQPVPTIFWRSDPSYQVSVELTRWLYVASAFIFFALFGFSGEAQKSYKKLFWTCAKRFGITPSTKSKSVKISLPGWKKPTDSSTIASPHSPVYSWSKPPPLSSTSSRFSLVSSNATIHVDMDVEKGFEPASPSTTNFSSCHTYPPSSASNHSATDFGRMSSPETDPH